MRFRSRARRVVRGALAALLAMGLVPMLSRLSEASPSSPPPRSTPPPSEMPEGQKPPGDDEAAKAKQDRASAEQLYTKGYDETEDAKKELASGKADSAKKKFGKALKWDPLESTCRHASLSIL